jgi:hypothetical protein
MSQVIVGMFACYRDGHDALRALQNAGLKRDDAHLYRTDNASVESDHFPPFMHDEDDAEYIAHGEHQGVICTRNRYAPERPAQDRVSAAYARDDGARHRTLLVIRVTDEIKPNSIGDVLHEHGALAVKDAAGHWHFSPFRKTVRA